MSSTTLSSIKKMSQRVIELWPAQDFITMGDNSRAQSELSFLYATRLLNVLYLMMKYHENTLNFRVMGRTRFKNYGK